MPLTITPIYAALIAIVYLVLTARVILYRRANRVNLGDEGDKHMLKRMRAHANCAEYAPFALLLLLFAELQGASASVVHIFGMMILVGRVVHAIGLSVSPQNFLMRQIGMILTLTMIAVTALSLLVMAIF